MKDKLDLLREKVEYWKTMSWSETTEYGLGISRKTIRRICHGLLLMISSSSLPTSHDPQTLLVELTGPRPSVMPYKFEPSLLQALITHDFCFDPGRDLLLIQQIEGSVYWHIGFSVAYSFKGNTFMCDQSPFLHRLCTHFRGNHRICCPMCMSEALSFYTPMNIWRLAMLGLVNPHNLRL